MIEEWWVDLDALIEEVDLSGPSPSDSGQGWRPLDLGLDAETADELVAEAHCAGD